MTHYQKERHLRMIEKDFFMNGVTGITEEYQVPFQWIVKDKKYHLKFQYQGKEYIIPAPGMTDTPDPAKKACFMQFAVWEIDFFIEGICFEQFAKEHIKQMTDAENYTSASQGK